MRRERGPAHCLGLLATRRPCEMDAALVGNQSRRIKHRGSCERQYDWARSKKNEIKPHLVQQWVIPPQASSAFVAAMEDALAVYKRPRDGDGPLVCLDETSKQLLAGTRAPNPDEAGTTGAMRLRIRTQRHGQSVHDVRPARRLAARQRH